MTRNPILIIILLLIPLCSFGQRKKKEFYIKPRVVTEKEYELAKKHEQCFFHGKFSAEERKTFFPFNKTYEVRLISHVWADSREEWERDSLPVFIPLSQSSFAINPIRLKEQKTLSASAIDSLTNILFNYGYTTVKGKILLTGFTGYNCYEPHNSILFLDKSGKVKYYFEICFGCQRHYWSTSKVNDMIYCTEKYEMLRSFFVNQGVLYGTELPHSEE